MDARYSGLNKLSDRNDYGSKPWYVRAYRRCRYMAPAVIEAAVELLGWTLLGCPYRFPLMLQRKTIRWNRWREAKVIWSKHVSFAHYLMGNCASLPEYIESLRQRCKKES